MGKFTKTAFIKNLQVTNVEINDEIQKGISLIEFYDMIEIKNNKNKNLLKKDKKYKHLQEIIKKTMEGWAPCQHHKNIVDKIKNLNTPILTTNFDETLAKAGKCQLFRTTKDGFTDFYPWSAYYGDKQHQLQLPTDGFGIWHINGMIYYPGA